MVIYGIRDRRAYNRKRSPFFLEGSCNRCADYFSDSYPSKDSDTFFLSRRCSDARALRLSPDASFFPGSDLSAVLILRLFPLQYSGRRGLFRSPPASPSLGKTPSVKAPSPGGRLFFAKASPRWCTLRRRNSSLSPNYSYISFSARFWARLVPAPFPSSPSKLL